MQVGRGEPDRNVEDPAAAGIDPGGIAASQLGPPLELKTSAKLSLGIPTTCSSHRLHAADDDEHTLTELGIFSIRYADSHLAHRRAPAVVCLPELAGHQADLRTADRNAAQLLSITHSGAALRSPRGSRRRRPLTASGTTANPGQPIGRSDLAMGLAQISVKRGPYGEYAANSATRHISAGQGVRVSG